MGVLIREILERHYAKSEAPVAFLDESYELTGTNKFYVLSCALADPAEIPVTRRALLDCYGGEAMHAAPMFHRSEYTALRAGIEVSAKHHDGLDLIVQSELKDTDSTGLEARKRCIEHVVSMLHDEERTTVFVLDALRTQRMERFDRMAFTDMRRSGRIGRDVLGIHARPSVEPLLGLPNLLAWTFRRK